MSKEKCSVRSLRTVMRHCMNVQSALRKVISNLQERAKMHDISKLHDDEFEAVLHYQELDGIPYGSEEYKTKMDEIRPLTQAGWELHIQRNSHHPEHHNNIKDMGVLDIIEMVCDWKGANATYNTSGQGFRESAEVCLEKYDFDVGQTWLIRQLIDLLDDKKGR